MGERYEAFFTGDSCLSELPLNGLRVLLLEDEALIALDVEQICRDAGAADVTVVHDLSQLGEGGVQADAHDAAVIDVMLRGVPTVEAARRLKENGMPFVFATGYVDRHEIFDEFPGIAVIGKPYAGGDLVEALGRAVARRRMAG
jgi:CheY-like chemotaxis protein